MSDICVHLCSSVVRFFLRFAAVVQRRRRGQLGALLFLIAGVSIGPAHAAVDNTGERSPRATTGAFSNGSNALACDRIVARATGTDQSQTFSLYGFRVPADALVTGILVRVSANDGAASNRNLQVSLSWDGGRRFTAPLQTRNFESNAPLRDYVVGGSRVRWGHAWTPTEIGDANFRVRLLSSMTGGSSSDAINVDCPPAVVFYEIPTPVPRTPQPEPTAESMGGSPPARTPPAP